MSHSPTCGFSVLPNYKLRILWLWIGENRELMLEVPRLQSLNPFYTNLPSPTTAKFVFFD